MTALFDVDFENNLLFDPGASGKGFDLIHVDGGTLAVNTASKYSGTYGCAATPVAGHVAGGAKIIHNPASGKLRQAFWFDPNSITIPSGSYLCIARNYHYDLSQMMYQIMLTWTGTSYALEHWLGDNTFAAAAYSATFNITDAYHLIELYWQRGTPGSLQMWIDGVDKGVITATNNLCWVITPGIGCNLRTAPSVATTGSVYFDRWRANDDGGVIGA